MEQYRLEKLAFYKKHRVVISEESHLVRDITLKTVIFEDGKIWYEIYGKYVEKVTTTITVKGIDLEINLDVDLFRIEYWSSDNSTNKFAYEKY